MDLFDEMSQSLQAHPTKAQILLEVEAKGKTLEAALGILNAHGIRQKEHEVISKGDPSLVLFHLSTNDMRDAILRLTEAGFMRLKGIASVKLSAQKEGHQKEF